MSSRKLLKRSRTSADYSDQEEHNPPKKPKLTTRSNNDSPASPRKLLEASQTVTPLPVVASKKVSPPTGKIFAGQTSRGSIDLATSSEAHEHSKQENQHKHNRRVQKEIDFDPCHMGDSNSKCHDNGASNSTPRHATGGKQSPPDYRNLIANRKVSPQYIQLDPFELSPVQVPSNSPAPHDIHGLNLKPYEQSPSYFNEDRKWRPQSSDSFQNSLSPYCMPFIPSLPHDRHGLKVKPYHTKGGQPPLPDLREFMEDERRSRQNADSPQLNSRSFRMNRESNRKGKRSSREWPAEEGETPRKKHRMYHQSTSRDAPQGRYQHGLQPNQTDFFQNLAFSDPQQLHDLASKEPKKQLAILQRRREEFGEFTCSLLDYSDVDHSIKVNLIVKILSSLLKEDREFSKRASKFVISELTEVNNHPLLQALKYIFGGMPMESSHAKRNPFLGFLSDANLFFKQLLEKRPSFFSQNLPIDAFQGCLKQLASQEIRYQRIYEQSQQLVQQRDAIRATSYETSGGFQHGDSKEQGLNTTLPTQEELKQSTLPLDLKPNSIKGPYASIEDYLTVQYRLLREDFIHPLRCALHKLQTKGEEEEDDHGVMVYRNVRFNKHQPREGTVFRVSFEIPGQKQVKWECSKRLTYGSLLCLSADGFKEVIFATVEESKQDLQQVIVTINLVSNIDGFAVSPELIFEMAESPGYYCAYESVLMRLNDMRKTPLLLPFSEYLVECSSTVKPPAYLSEEGKSVMNLARVVCECNGALDCPHKAVDVFNDDVWSEMKTPRLDPAQKLALRVALKNELAIIQGPPGTGKTFIGLKIVDVLLRNCHCRSQNGPIVVVCYTNHALDQFLEGLLSIEPKGNYHNVIIRRVGGRCKNEKIEPYNIRTHVTRECHNRGIFYGCSLNEVRQLRQKIEALGQILAGEYVPSNFEVYCSILEQQTIRDLQFLCGINFLNRLQERHEHGHLAAWLSLEFQTRIDNWRNKSGRESLEEDYIHFYRRAVEDARRITTEESKKDSFLCKALGRQAVATFVTIFKKVEPLTEETAKVVCKARSPHDVGDFVRLQLFKYFLSELRFELKEYLKQKERKLTYYKKERALIMVECLKSADVIGITTTGAAMHNSVLSQIEAKTVIIEEAAEVLEAHVVTTLTRHTQHLILIGDHKQLRPKTNDHILARDYHLDVSLFERLITNGFPYVTLEVQHRMRPEISDLVSSSVYDGKLKNHPSTETYNDIRGMKHNVFFVDHEEPETAGDDLIDKSPANDHEANFLARLCKYLLQQGYRPEEITVITPYTGQMYRLQESFSNAGINDVRITPIDNYQGEENEIILLSLVRSDKPGFVKDSNRICVALSRAKQGFYCVGNFSLFGRSSPLWRSIVTGLTDKERIGKSLPLQCARHEVITEVTSAIDFDKVIDGGCDKKCGCRLPKCNHICPRNCHPGDEVHEKPCKEPCPKYCPSASRHRCKLLCYQDCGECLEPVEKVIPSCGHKQQVPCYEDPSDFICQLKCQKTLICDHRCRKKCGELCTTECREYVTRVWPCGHEAQAECYITEEKFLYRRKCKIPCEVILECGHRCVGTCGGCYQGRLHKRCQEKCKRPLMCGHTCSERCALNCPPCNKPCIYACPHGKCGGTCSEVCSPCPHRCEWKCDHIECKENCGDICNRQRCDEPCSKSLPCGHPCPGTCGEPCPTANNKPICKVCDKETWIELVPGMEDEEEARYIQLVDCGHIFEVGWLDHWMDMEPESERVEIKWKECFTCKKPIHKTRRYGNVTKRIVADMNEIKKKNLHALGKDERQKLENEVKDMAQTHICSFFRDEEDVRRYMMKINENLPDSTLQKEHVILSATKDAQEVTKSLERITSDPSEHPSIIALRKKTAILIAQTKMFADFIKDNRYIKMTNQIQFDILAERRRIMILATVYELQHHVEQLRTIGVELEATDTVLVECITTRCETQGQKVERPLHDDTEYLRMQSQLQEVCTKYGAQPLTKDKREMVIKALSAKHGSWYKCPKGHYYQLIGDCGGAMVEGKCPDCGAIIGGHSHQPLADNDPAGEFDDSRHAAWSTGANLEDYDQEQLCNHGHL